MYGLSLGVQHMSEILPAPVYALLSGLNASTVGIIALAAVQLAEKAIKDKLTRILVIAGACAGLCYNALWYFPLLMAIGGIASVLWDGWLSQKIGIMKVRWRQRKRDPENIVEEETNAASVPIEGQTEGQGSIQRRNVPAGPQKSGQASETISRDSAPLRSNSPENAPTYTIRIRVGIALVVLFFCKP